MSEGQSPPLVLLGVGPAALAVARAARGARELVGTTRSPERAPALEAAGIRPVVAPALSPDDLAALAPGADLVVSFPPDGSTDRRLAPACRGARALVYISSTGVYGHHVGTVDDATPVAPDDPRAAPRLDAEAAWREAGAVVLRAPGLYDATTGLHRRLLAGGFRLTGDGSGVLSRIHLDDLAALTLAALDPAQRGETFVVGDLAPAPQLEVVSWLCQRLGLPLPPSAPPDQVHPSLRGGRAVDPRRALARLGVTLRYPTYREGFAAALAGLEKAP
ncbi:MAG TPA: NAD(P)H-binding protein [Polyangiaceae bacterium]|nr:NAD(P)H-binding protein [Polyangiaceae bacterium]